jgi:hypothetical protein
MSHLEILLCSNRVICLLIPSTCLLEVGLQASLQVLNFMFPAFNLWIQVQRFKAMSNK